MTTIVNLLCLLNITNKTFNGMHKSLLYRVWRLACIRACRFFGSGVGWLVVGQKLSRGFLRLVAPLPTFPRLPARYSLACLSRACSLYWQPAASLTARVFYDSGSGPP